MSDYEKLVQRRQALLDEYFEITMQIQEIECTEGPIAKLIQEGHVLECREHNPGYPTDIDTIWFLDHKEVTGDNPLLTSLREFNCDQFRKVPGEFVNGWQAYYYLPNSGEQ